jgi:hypothetical protein
MNTSQKMQNTMMDLSIPFSEGGDLSVGDLSIDFDLDDDDELEPKETVNPRGGRQHHHNDDSSHYNYANASMSSLSCSYATLGASLSSLCSTRWESEHTKSSAGSGPARRVTRCRSGSIRRVQRVKSFDTKESSPAPQSSSANKAGKVGPPCELGVQQGFFPPRRPVLKNIMPNRRVFRNTSLNEKLQFEAAITPTCESSCTTFASSYARLVATERIDLADSVTSFEADWHDEDDAAENTSHSASSGSMKKKNMAINPRLKRHNSANDALMSSGILSTMQHMLQNANDENKVVVLKKEDTTMRSLFNREDTSLMMPPRLPSRTTEAS